MSIAEDMTRTAAASVADDLADIAEFFGIASRGADMVRLTGLSNASLSRIQTGLQVTLRPVAAGHVSVLGQFVRESRAVMARHGVDPAPQAMRTWLHNSFVAIDGDVYTPIEALSEPSTAARALAQIKEESHLT